MKKNTLTKLACWILAVSIPSLWGPIYAQSLDEVLGAGKTEYKQAKPETMEKWENILTMLEASRFEAALPELQKYRGIDDVTEPYQKLFVDSVIILIEPGDQFMRADDVNLRYSKSIDNLKKDRADLCSENKELEAQLPAIEKKIKDAATGEGVGNAVGGMLGLGSVGQISKAGKEGAERELIRIKEKINKNETQIAQIDAKTEKLKKGQEEEVTKLDSQFQDEQKILRDKISTQIKELTKSNHSRTAAVLANVYMRKRGNDVEIGKLAQQATENLKNESKAIEVAKVALKPVREMMGKMKLWTAKGELEKAFAAIKNRISDNSLTELISREVMMVKYELDEKIKKVNDEIENSMDLAKEDPVQAESKLMVLKKTYVDDPDLEKRINEVRTTRFEKEEKTILRLSQTDPEAAEKKLAEFIERNPDYPNADNLKIKVKEIKFAKRISAIEEVIHNDPAEAKKMIKTLMASGLTPDDISVVKSKVSKLERQILDKEFDSIKADMDEAQGYLTKFNTQVAGSGNLPTDGKIAKVDFIASLSIGTENLVRARSIQVGAQKRLEILMQEPMDNVMKAKLTGLLETQKAAVEQMDDVTNSQRNNRILAGAGFGTILLVGGAGGVMAKRRFKKSVKADKSNS
ncbi:MAG: hypothetical protein EBU36_01795 [Verrucomicrobia bacterium]|jgi:hypothetical protein|nr:hypothetical protein [Verrucomicrobiota bacterium]